MAIGAARTAPKPVSQMMIARQLRREITDRYERQMRGGRSVSAEKNPDAQRRVSGRR